MAISPPISKNELIDRANTLAGITINQLANQLNVDVPTSLVHAKGWFGSLLEQALGADAASAPEPDFVKLGIELKSLPVNSNGKPKESTYICVAQLDPAALSSWDKSLVKCKLNNVLWVPYEANSDIPIGLRRIGSPLLWKPDTQQEDQLREDWQELSDMIVLGNIDKISSSMGKYLQIRPKGANSQSLVENKNQLVTNKLTLPRGFYLRTTFTHSIISTDRH